MLTSYGNLVDDIHSLVFVFQSAQIVYVHRGCNVVADALVKKSKNLLGLQVWLDNMPEDISQLISFDVPQFCLSMNSQTKSLISQQKKKKNIGRHFTIN